MATRTRLTREQRKAQTRADLLGAASRLFATHGLHGASVDAIAAEAGYTTGALYSNFAGKEDLFLVLLEQTIEQFADEHAQSADAGGEELDARIASATRNYLRHITERPRDFLLIVELWAYAVRNPRRRKDFAQRYDRVRERLTALIERDARELDLQLAMPAAELAAIIDALVDGFALQKLAAPDAVDDELIVRAVQTLFAGALETRQKR